MVLQSMVEVGVVQGLEEEEVDCFEVVSEEYSCLEEAKEVVVRSQLLIFVVAEATEF